MRLVVNGREHEGECEPRLLLVDFLRDSLGLTGTHVGCEHGVCGACTTSFDGQAVHSCLLFAGQAHGAQLRTVEGMAPGPTELHPIQQAFHEAHALQCGFCTPGFLLTVEALLLDKPDPSDTEIREALSGNLCRCTGYRTSSPPWTWRPGTCHPEPAKDLIAPSPERFGVDATRSFVVPPQDDSSSRPGWRVCAERNGLTGPEHWGF
jgi:carbon-monoxide dehydrogenase small subunit